MLETERLILKLLDEDDEQQILQWRNDKEVVNSLFSFKGLTLKEHRDWYESYLKNGNRIEFVIKLKASDKKIGTIGLSNIDYRNQKAEYGIILGDKGEQGKGYAREASRAVIEYGFNELNIQKIYLKVFCDNNKAITLYNKLGLTVEGVLRKDVYKDGIFKDVTIMSVLKDEWRSE